MHLLKPLIPPIPNVYLDRTLLNSGIHANFIEQYPERARYLKIEINYQNEYEESL